MDHKDHVFLLRKGVPRTGGKWADFGSGRGAFTLALAELLGSNGELYSVDRDEGALKSQRQALETHYPNLKAHFLAMDFTRLISLPPLDGLVVANALHFFKEKSTIVQLLSSYLAPGGRFILVEYNTDHGNRWVPFPISYSSWRYLAEQNELVNTQLLGTVPSSFLGEIYSTASTNT